MVFTSVVIMGIVKTHHVNHKVIFFMYPWSGIGFPLSLSTVGVAEIITLRATQFLYLNKEITEDENKPKYFVGSPCSVWGSHLFANRHNDLALHLVKNDSSFTAEEQKCLVMLMDVLKSYCLQTNEDDTRQYEVRLYRFSFEMVWFCS